MDHADYFVGKTDVSPQSKPGVSLSKLVIKKEAVFDSTRSP